MNNYPEWWNITVTLYNKYLDPTSKKVSWYPTVIDGCFYQHTLDKITVGNSTISSNVSICRIRVNDAFVNKRDWNELPGEEKQHHFTLSEGDIIVAGEVDFEVNDYESDKRSSDLMKTYKEWPGCFVVETVNINVGGGRGNEHYLARGI